MSAGGLAGFGLLLFISLLFVGLLGGVVDQLGKTNSDLVTAPGAIASQDRVDTIHWLVYAFAAMPVMIILAGGFNYWITNIKDSSGEV